MEVGAKDGVEVFYLHLADSLWFDQSHVVHKPVEFESTSKLAERSLGLLQVRQVDGNQVAGKRCIRAPSQANYLVASASKTIGQRAADPFAGACD
ncbi:hypothetical protein CS8_087070 [Cupriavidus sp. 8B]